MMQLLSIDKIIQEITIIYKNMHVMGDYNKEFINLLFYKQSGVQIFLTYKPLHAQNILVFTLHPCEAGAGH